ncbi:MAG: tetratricopeptide repeat protein, partial [Anaerolineae bacterium]
MEQYPLLQTKLHIPPIRANLVSRPRLIERLDAGLHRKLTLVSAPAGFGKTTLVGEWVADLRSGAMDGAIQSIAWLSLDESDDDLVRFLTYLIAALQTVEADIGKSASSVLQAAQPQPPSAEAILTLLINEIAILPGRIVLVLDDYHLVEAQPIHEAVAFLLRRLPPPPAGLHLAIVTREDPPLPLARLRARGQLTELRARDLLFTPSESAVFLHRTMGLNLSTDDIATLEERTEGWIAGLQLAAISMQGRSDVHSFTESFSGSHRYVLDYLFEEVLRQQSESVQTFLLRTSILDRLTGSLCAALSDEEDGQQTLEMLERANLFVVPLDEDRRWYRYHRLFADLLRQRLRQTQPETLPLLHIKAAEWFTSHGLSREAIGHLLAAKDYRGAADLIQAIALDVVQQGEHTTVVGWINALPEEFVKAQPYLGILHAWTLQLTGQLEAAQAHLSDAERALESPDCCDRENIDTIRGLLNSRRAYQTFMLGEHDKTIASALAAIDQLPETARLIRAQTMLFLGIAYRYQGQPQAALDIYREVLPLAETMGGSALAVLSYLHMGDLYVEMTQLHRAKEVYEQALEFTARHTGRPDLPFTGYAYVSIGRVLRQWNQVEEAYRFTTRGLALCRDWNVADIIVLSCIELAWTHWALGNVEQARDYFREATQLMEGFSEWGVAIAAAHQAKFDLARGDMEGAERWAQANNLVIEGDFEFHREIEYLTLARVFIAQARFEAAHSLVDRIYRIAQGSGRKQTELEGLILLALVLSAQGETDQALVHLEEAIAIGEPEGFVRIFVDEGPPMARLLYQAAERGIAPEYTRRLLAA